MQTTRLFNSRSYIGEPLVVDYFCRFVVVVVVVYTSNWPLKSNENVKRMNIFVAMCSQNSVFGP